MYLSKMTVSLGNLRRPSSYNVTAFSNSNVSVNSSAFFIRSRFDRIVRSMFSISPVYSFTTYFLAIPSENNGLVSSSVLFEFLSSSGFLLAYG